jgi:GDP-4-dehydro-6-deoxy-D-mannose reductase
MIRYLQQIKGISIYGVDQNRTDSIEEYQLDLMQFDPINRIIEKIRPDMVINLSGLIRSDNSGMLYASNVLPVINTVQSLIRSGLSNTGFLVISSASVYGDSGICPILEENPAKPVNIYGTSKLAMEQLLPVLNMGNKCRIMVARTFNLMGPGLAESLSIPSFIRQLIQIMKHNATPIIKTGNLTPGRDYIDIRDAVKAYWKIITEGKSGEIYNVGSGKLVKMQEILDILIALTGKEVRIETDNTLVRKNEIMNSQADIRKIKSLGWSPEIDLRRSLNDMMDYYQKGN